MGLMLYNESCSARSFETDMVDLAQIFIVSTVIRVEEVGQCTIFMVF